MYKYYCGVGSRQTPDYICQVFSHIASQLDELGYTLRSGGAPGADLSFEKGANKKQIWLPWIGFNNSKEKYIYSKELTEPIARLVINDQHWNRLSEAGKKMHCRNVHQVLGNLVDEPISEFVLCWTKDAETIGGTATAIKLANKFDIPVFNFGKCKNTLDAMIYWEHVMMFMELNEN
jgi:hypothetical protein